MAESTFDAFTAAEAPISSSGMEEDPAADFLAQQESEIAGIESDGYSILDTGEMPSDMQDFSGPIGELNGDIYKEANGPSDGFAAVAQADKLSAEPESLRRWREDQTERLEEMDVTSRKLEGEWREKARHELEEWYVRQSEQLEKTRKNNRVADGAFYKQQNADMIGYMTFSQKDFGLSRCVRKLQLGFLLSQQWGPPGSPTIEPPFIVLATDGGCRGGFRARSR
uniref:clathrin light chain A-like isoform X2 n=1 Tax=Myxine glutinosa TaxID=7769 RepID=UPI00358F7C43